LELALTGTLLPGEIYRLYTDGDDLGPMSMREIAAKLGCSVGTVHRVIKKLEE
jgi:DNA-binding MarR family transcriptional regulator